MAQRGRPTAQIVLNDDERETLQRWARRPKTGQALALRCRIVLAAASGSTNQDIARQLSCNPVTVGKWRTRFASKRLDRRSVRRLDIATGEVLHDTRRRHSGQDVLAFFKLIDPHVPRHLDVHVVLDNLSAHKSEPVTTWLAHPRRKRWHLHFTPTSASWLNMIEGWFSILTRRALTNTSLSSTTELTDRIDWWASHWNDDPRPFVWAKTVDDIITKVKRGRAALTESATHH